MLDDGRLTDNKGRVVNFKNTIVIMTSNMGSHIIQENFAELEGKNIDMVVDSTREQVMDLLKQTLRPEFLNRVDSSPYINAFIRSATTSFGSKLATLQ